MKNKIPYLFAALILLVSIIISCKKDPSPSPSPSPNIDTNPTIRKWLIARHIDTTSYFNGPTIYLDYQPTNGDYFDLRTDGKLYVLENGVMDTCDYTLSTDRLILNRTHVPFVTTFIIEVSTSDSLQLNGTTSVLYNSHDYEHIHYYLNN